MPLATTELSLAGVRGELECAICTEVMEHPCSLSCAHSFCKACLEKAVGEDGSVRCPMCRKRSITRDGFVENKTLRVVCEHARAAHKAECPTHEGIVMDYYCSTCDELICDRCAILGDAHRGHAIDTIAHRCAATRRELKAAHEEVSRRSNAIDELVRTGGRIDAAHDGLLTRVDEAADEAIARIEALRAQARDALLSHARVEKAALRNAQRPVAERARHLDAAAATLPRVGGQLALAREAREGLRLPELQPPTWDAARAAAFLEQQPPFTELRRIYTASGADREAAMQVFVSGARTLSAAIKPRDTAGALKEFVLQQVGVPIGRQCLYVGGKPLDDSKPLVAQGVAKGATIELRLRVSRRASEEVRKRQFWQTL